MSLALTTTKPISPELFAGIYSYIGLPRVATKQAFVDSTITAILIKPPLAKAVPSFEGISSASALTKPINPQVFAGTSSYTNLPTKVNFTGVISRSILPEPIASAKPAFERVNASSIMPKPVSPLIFESVTGEAKIRVMFPGGQKIIPTYGVGVPLGAEKPLLEPSIKEEEEKE